MIRPWIYAGIAVGGLAAGALIAHAIRGSRAPASNPSPAPSRSWVPPDVPDPAQEAEPEGDWEQTYSASFASALGSCVEDPDVVAFDQAVLRLLEHIFPAAGSFALRPATGAWKLRARDRARADLASSLGSTEAEARATLCAPLGRQAMAAGMDLGQAIRSMGTRAFPAASWDFPSSSSWQRLFCDCAARALSA